MKRKKIVLPVIVVTLSFAIGYFLGNRNANLSNKTQSSNKNQTDPVLAETEVNKSFDFPVFDDSGEENSDNKISLSIVVAKKVSYVTSQNETINAPSGKSILILSLEIQNTQPQTVQMSTQNLVRLVIDGKNYPPDFYNDQIEVPPVAVKKDELGFVVPENQKQFTLSVGQVDDENKQQVEINF
jgi:hypothetical protein